MLDRNAPSTSLDAVLEGDLLQLGKFLSPSSQLFKQLRSLHFPHRQSQAKAHNGSWQALYQRSSPPSESLYMIFAPIFIRLLVFTVIIIIFLILILIDQLSEYGVAYTNYLQALELRQTMDRLFLLEVPCYLAGTNISRNVQRSERVLGSSQKAINNLASDLLRSIRFHSIERELQVLEVEGILDHIVDAFTIE